MRRPALGSGQNIPMSYPLGIESGLLQLPLLKASDTVLLSARGWLDSG